MTLPEHSWDVVEREHHDQALVVLEACDILEAAKIRLCHLFRNPEQVRQPRLDDFLLLKLHQAPLVAVLRVYEVSDQQKSEHLVVVEVEVEVVLK